MVCQATVKSSNRSLLYSMAETKSGESEIFLRRASGLVRTISPRDALIYASAGPGPVFAFLYLLWAPGLYPGANMVWAPFTLLLLLPIMAVYYLFSISMPRSGGEYVYVSRILNPALGLFANWALTIIGISWTGELSSWVVTYGIAPLIYNAGLLNGNSSLLSVGLTLSNPASPAPWVIGFGFIALSYFMLWRGAKTAMKVFWVGIVIGFIGLIAISVAGLISSPTIFAARLQSLSSVNFATQIVQAAKTAGYSQKVSIFASLLAGSSYINLSLLGNTYTTNIAGEVKRVSRAQPLALFGSLVFFLAFWEILSNSMWKAPGGTFWNTVSYLVDAGKNPMPLTPVANDIVVYLTSNPVLVYLASIGFIFGCFASATGLSLGPIRNLFAWSFDRIIPERFAKVDRRGSPYGAVLLATAGGCIFYVLYTLTTLLSFILFTITLWFVAWTVVGITAIVFPYVKKDIFEKSPQMVQTKFLGVPIISIAGVCAAAVSIFTVYVTTVPAIVGLTSLSDLLSTVVVLAVIPFVLYFIVRSYRKRSGVKMDLQFKTLPPD